MFIVFSTQAIPGFNIKLTKKIPISQETTLLERPRAFCVTEDKLFLIPDYKAGDVKIYDSNGKLVTVFGRKGYGPGEFSKPAHCFYNKEEGKFGVLDFGLRKIFIYQKTSKTGFKRVKEVYCLAAGTDIQLKGNKLVISGHKTDQYGNPNALYYIDIIDDKATYLLPSYYRYGLKSYREYEIQHLRKPDIPAIGIGAWIDIQGESVYYIWEGDLRIIKINMKSGKLDFFGEKPSHYIKPFATKQMIEGRRNRNTNIVESEKAKMSYIRDIFASPKYVLVIYERPVRQDKESNFRLQFYTLDGGFLEDIPIPGKPGKTMCLDKDKDILYSLTSEMRDDLNEEYFILEYNIVK